MRGRGGSAGEGCVYLSTCSLRHNLLAGWAAPAGCTYGVRDEGRGGFLYPEILYVKTVHSSLCLNYVTIDILC